MVELIVNGQTVELSRKISPKYTKQIGDVFEIGTVSASYTNSFNAPKTPNNTALFEQLGIAGDTSSIPYEKVAASLSFYGLPVIQSGWLSIKDTTDDYKLSIIDGIIDFFKDIENKTMGVALNLSQFNHIKDLSTVIDSFDGEFYRYIVANYGGKVFAKPLGNNGINIDYLVPCFNVGKLFDLVMTTFGYSYSTANIESLFETYITYPKSPDENSIDTLFAEFTKGFWVRTPVNFGGGIYGVPSEEYWATSNVIEGTLIENWRYIVPADGGYKINAIVEAYAHYLLTVPFTGQEFEFFKPMTVNITQNSNTFLSFQTDPNNPVEGEISIYLSQGDVIDFELRVSGAYVGDLPLKDIHHNSTDLKIYRTNQGGVSLTDVFKDFQIKDFIKECFWRTAVTPVLDVVNRSMKFVSISERLDISKSKD